MFLLYFNKHPLLYFVVKQFLNDNENSKADILHRRNMAKLFGNIWLQQ